MPMQFAHTTGLNGHQGCSNIFRGEEIARVNDANFTAPRFLRGGHRRHLEGVLVRGFDATPANSSLVLCQRCGQICSKDIQALVRQILKSTRRQPKILRQHRWRRAPHPVGKKEGVVFRKRTLIEHQNKFTTIRSQPLDRVRKSCWKVPEITFSNIADEHGSIGVKAGHAGISVQHNGPLVGRVPMQLPKTPRRKPHSDAREVL